MKQCFTPFTPPMPPKKPHQTDYALTYPEVQQLLNLSRRSIQALVAEGKLHKKMIQGPNGMQAFFSEQEIATLGGVKQRGEEPAQKLIRYETGIGLFQQMIKDRDAILAKQTEEVKTLLLEKGELTGSLKAAQAQLREQQALERELIGSKERLKSQPAYWMTWVLIAFLAGLVVAFAFGERLSALVAGR